MKALVLAALLASPLARAAAPVVFFEIPVSDASKSVDFYRVLFGWQFSQNPHSPQMWMLTNANGLTGALVEHKDLPKQAGGVLIYLQVEHTGETLALAEKMGGTIETPATRIPTVGTIGILRDRDANEIGLISDEGK